MNFPVFEKPLHFLENSPKVITLKNIITVTRPELTAEKFIDNPFGEGKLYKTGDLAYWREDGNIAYVGRNDFQVKIRGLRIELGEIENAIAETDGVVHSVVVVRKDKNGRQIICAFYTGEEKASKESCIPETSLPYGTRLYIRSLTGLRPTMSTFWRTEASLQ